MEVGKPSEKGKWIELVYTQDGRVGKLYSNGDRYLAGTMLSEFCIYDRVIVE